MEEVDIFFCCCFTRCVQLTSDAPSISLRDIRVNLIFGGFDSLERMKTQHAAGLQSLSV